MPEATQIRVELVTRNEPGSNPAGDRLKFAVTDQCANVVLGAAELGGNLADRQGCGRLHPPEYGLRQQHRGLNRPEPQFGFHRIARSRLAASRIEF
jgi:hypothetical protein